jgi:hypothetical protein
MDPRLSQLNSLSAGIIHSFDHRLQGSEGMLVIECLFLSLGIFFIQSLDFDLKGINFSLLVFEFMCYDGLKTFYFCLLYLKKFCFRSFMHYHFKAKHCLSAYYSFLYFIIEPYY